MRLQILANSFFSSSRVRAFSLYLRIQTFLRFLASTGSSRGLIFAVTGSVASELLFHHLLFDASPLAFLGRVTACFITLYTLYRFSIATLGRKLGKSRDIFFLAGTLVMLLIVVWMGRIIALSLTNYATKFWLLEGVSPIAIYFAIPFAAGGLVVQTILGLSYGFVLAVSISVIVGLYFPSEPLLASLALVTNLVACLSISQLRSRLAFIKAGFNVTLLLVVFALISIVIDGAFGLSDVAGRLLGALIGGSFCALIAAGVTPVVEYLGGYITDMRLIEMATLDHPLLKELSIQAPGTWNHSMVMGMMAESAANAVGANSVMARVGCYFHDIGKIKKPLYFVENQGNGENRHDKLSPSMSALIIRSHVKDGVELARKHKVPAILEDMILQHHGTSLIEYFYDKAQKEAAKESQKDLPAELIEVDRAWYQYPGPRPQTREAGILMLADGIEAASRTLSDQSSDRIQGMVQKMINKVFASGELDECELTLKDLHLIAKCFTRVLSAIYHQRISYSEPVEKAHAKSSETGGKGSEAQEIGREDSARASSGNLSSPLGSSGARKIQSGANEQEGHKEASKENLKRLGL